MPASDCWGEMPAELIRVCVNGEWREGLAEPRLLLVDFVRHELRLTGTHVGCEHGVCGACSLQLEGAVVRSCLLFAVQADGLRIDTVEGLARGGDLDPVQQAFHRQHALQCGFCTPGFLLLTHELLAKTADPSDDQIRDALSANICRCTGYNSIVEAVRAAAGSMRAQPSAGRTA